VLGAVWLANGFIDIAFGRWRTRYGRVVGGDVIDEPPAGRMAPLLLLPSGDPDGSQVWGRRAYLRPKR